MIELEAKIAIEDFSDIKARLSAAGVEMAGRSAETNVFFDTPDRRLLAADKGLRLRHKRDLSTNHDQYILTFKGPNHPGPMKQREERELIVESEADARALLQSLGYEPIFQFQKQRETVKLADCEISLDEIPDLGQFVEIEGPDQAAIESVIEQLGLKEKPLIRESYVALLMRRGGHQ